MKVAGGASSIIDKVLYSMGIVMAHWAIKKVLQVLTMK